MVLKIHMVKSGDTLYELSKKYQVSLEEIIANNAQIVDPNKIEVGMKVKIPSKSQQLESPDSEMAYIHTVKQGDTLWKLSKGWGLPLKTLVDANPQLKNPSVLLIGEVVKIPKLGTKPDTSMIHSQHHPSSTMMPILENPFGNSPQPPAALPPTEQLAPIQSNPMNMPNMPNSYPIQNMPYPMTSPSMMSPISPLTQANHNIPVTLPAPIVQQQATQAPAVLPPQHPNEVMKSIQPQQSFGETMKSDYLQSLQEFMVNQPAQFMPNSLEYSSVELFAQFPAPAIKAQGAVGVNQPFVATWESASTLENAAFAPQQPTISGIAPQQSMSSFAPNAPYSPKTDCGCGGNLMHPQQYANNPYDPQTAYISNNQHNPYNPYTANPYMEQQSHYSPNSPFIPAMMSNSPAGMSSPTMYQPPYFVPCYPLGPSSNPLGMPYANSMSMPNANIPSASTLGTMETPQKLQLDPSTDKKSSKSSKKSQRTVQIEDDQTILQSFLQKKTSDDTYKVSKPVLPSPWMNY
mgnify:CR=1 FL=1